MRSTDDNNPTNRCVVIVLFVLVLFALVVSLIQRGLQ